MKARGATWLNTLTHPCAVAILGARGSGKSSLGYYLVESLSSSLGLDVAILGLPGWCSKLLPSGYKLCQSPEELPHGSVAFIDEGSLLFSSRRSLSDSNVSMDQVLSLSRQRSQTIIFATHSLRKLDVALVSDMDCLAFKRPSFLHSRFERSEIRGFTQEAVKALEAVDMCDRKRFTWVLSQSYEGLLENPTPSFWTEQLSNGFGSTSKYGSVFLRHGHILSPEELAVFSGDEHFSPHRDQIDREGGLTAYQCRAALSDIRSKVTTAR